MRRNLRVKDMGGLLEEARPAVLLTHRPDRTPMLSPVWFRWRDGAFRPRWPRVTGSCLATRYLGPEGARAYVDAVAEEAVLVRLEPQSVRAWDFSDVWPAR
jgi:hypothetical protein